MLERVDPQLVVLDSTLPPWIDVAAWALDVRAHTDAGLLALDGAMPNANPATAVDEHLPASVGVREFLMEAESLLARSTPRERSEAEGVQLLPDQLRAIRDGSVLELTPTEGRLLATLMSRCGWPVSKRRLLHLVWRWEGYDENLVEVHVSSLRRRLERHGPRVIHTVRGRGYRFGASAREAALSAR